MTRRDALCALRCAACGVEAKPGRTAREARQKARSAGWGREADEWRCPQCRASEVWRGPDNAAASTAVRTAAAPVPAEQHNTKEQH